MSIVSLDDYRHYKIPTWSCWAIGCIGIIDSIIMKRTWIDCIFGFLSVSLALMLLYLLSKGKAIGGGDIKLLAVSGIFLGRSKNILAFILACFAVACFYPFRKKLFGKRKRLAFGPYLSLGIMVSLIWGDLLISAYRAWPGI